MQQPAVEKPQKQLLAWFVLIAGGLFLVPTLPYTLLLILMPLWKPDEVSFLSMLFTSIPACICAVVIWAMHKAYKAVRPTKTMLDREVPPVQTELPPPKTETEPPRAVKKPVWPWLVIIPGALALIFMGPGAMMLPIMPLYLAAMSTDSGTVPDYVPALLIVIGYSLIAAYAVLVVKAVKALRAK